jgi:hypothetical protein
MTSQLARIERQDATGRNGQARALRLEAAALLRDIQEAQFLIDRLQRFYLGGNEEKRNNMNVRVGHAQGLNGGRCYPQHGLSR